MACPEGLKFTEVVCERAAEDTAVLQEAGPAAVAGIQLTRRGATLGSSRFADELTELDRAMEHARRRSAADATTSNQNTFAKEALRALLKREICSHDLPIQM